MWNGEQSDHVVVEGITESMRTLTIKKGKA